MCVFLTIATCLFPVGDLGFIVLWSSSLFLSCHSMIFFSVHRLLAFARSINTLLHAACCPLIKAVENSVISCHSVILSSCHSMMFLSFPLLSSPFLCFPFHWSMGILCVFSHYSHMSVTCGGTCSLFSCPLPLSCPVLLRMFLSFSSFFLAHWSIEYLLWFPRAFYLCFSPL